MVDSKTELIRMLKSRRVIPFIGAGFSTALKLPNWEDLLKEISNEIEDDLSFEDIKKYCSNDYLQIAEYYFLKCDEKIGPIRNAISKSLHLDFNPILSPAHVELINLGAPQIYTTNYDDLIEKTFVKLGLHCKVVAIPKDIALADGSVSQVVKYHGDLRYEDTLVLTESKYYARLDFESPLDLKFRSDILGRSVLFLGYSFRDLNIRIIWFKLMKMMREIPASDRPASYIVRFGDNPVLEKLYESVGIKTIVLRPRSNEADDNNKNELIADFLLELSSNISHAGLMPDRTTKQFCSSILITKINKAVEILKSDKSERRGIIRKNRFAIDTIVRSISLMATRTIPKELYPALQNLRNDWTIINRELPSQPCIDFLKSYIENIGIDAFALFVVANLLLNADSRDKLDGVGLDWASMWKQKLNDGEILQLISRASSEVDHHSQGRFDEDLAYCIDLLTRIKLAAIYDGKTAKITKSIDDLLTKAEALYPSVARYSPVTDGAPYPEEIISEINDAASQQASADDLEPF